MHSSGSHGRERQGSPSRKQWLILPGMQSTKSFLLWCLRDLLQQSSWGHALPRLPPARDWERWWGGGIIGPGHFCPTWTSSMGDLGVRRPCWAGQDFLQATLMSEGLHTSTSSHPLISDQHHDLKALLGITILPFKLYLASQLIQTDTSKLCF